MKYGICICGLNGSGKTTLARALADALHYRHMDVEDYYFPDAEQPYANARPQEEAARLLAADVRKNPRFVFSTVNGKAWEAMLQACSLVIYLEAPVTLRMERIRRRAEERFGARVQPGGDLYEQEEAFFAFAEGRRTEPIEAWLQTLACPILRLDGRLPIEENLHRILSDLQSQSK